MDDNTPGPHSPGGDTLTRETWVCESCQQQPVTRRVDVTCHVDGTVYEVGVCDRCLLG